MINVAFAVSVAEIFPACGHVDRRSDCALPGTVRPPQCLAEEWDNVGLLVGDRSRPVRRLMTCLTITRASAAQAMEARADLVVTDHPLPFRPLKRLTADRPTGRMLLEMIAARIAVYRPHTAFDSAAEGINQRLAQGLGLRGVKPLGPGEGGPGSGGWGRLSLRPTLAKLAQRVKKFLSIDRLRLVGHSDQPILSGTVACGGAGELPEPARKSGCDAAGHCALPTPCSSIAASR